MTIATKFCELFKLEALKYRNKGLVNVVMACSALFCILMMAEAFGLNFWPEEVHNSMMK